VAKSAVTVGYIAADDGGITIQAEKNHIAGDLNNKQAGSTNHPGVVSYNTKGSWGWIKGQVQQSSVRFETPSDSKPRAEGGRDQSWQAA